MTGKKRRSTAGKTISSSMSIVEKLKILRGLNCGFSESDLSNCLRQSGYRVDVAAERLVTGQYRPLKKSNNSNQTAHRGTIVTNTSTATPRQARVRQQNHSSLTPSSSGPVDSGCHIIASNGEDKLTPSSMKMTDLTSGSHESSSLSNLVTPATKITNNGKVQTESNDWLICHRWIGNGVNLQRNGACDYLEEFHLLVESSSSPTSFPSSNNPKPIRFRSASHRMDGSFPRYLSFLGPLLSKGLIRVKATALMEERRLSIGAQVAFSLAVWIVDPVQFFAIFDAGNDCGSGVRSYSKQFFATVAAGTSANNFSRRGGKTNIDSSYRDVAFSMLQWSQHGKPPSPPQLEVGQDKNDDNAKSGREACDDNDVDNDPDNVTYHTSAEDEAAAIPNWAQDVLGSNDSENKSKIEDVRKVGYGKSHHGNEEVMETPIGFRKGIQLRPYQKESLYWMVHREKNLGSGTNKLVQLLQEIASESLTKATGSTEHNDVCVLESPNGISCDCGPVRVDTNQVDAPSVSRAFSIDNVHRGDVAADNHELDHPLWERRFLCNEQRTKALSFYVQPTFRNAAASPPLQPVPCRGGILADSMGLGKTIQLLALVQSDLNHKNIRDAKITSANTNNSTLVVAPLSLLYQWQEEIESKTSLSSKVHYNDGKSSGSNNFDVAVVLTTYGTLQAELRSQKDAEIGKSNVSNKEINLPLLSKTWKRVILDECHTIKNHKTMVAKACCLLRAERRWVVSGTIIQNSLEDVYSLMRFLRHEPFCEHAFWSSAVTKAPNFPVALNRVKNILSPIMIRRTKETRDKNGKLILSLPDIDSKSVVVQFSPEERQFYEALYRKSFDIFKGFVRAGTASSSWLKIFSLLHRLRQTCSHVALTVKSQLDDTAWTSSLGKFNANEICTNKDELKNNDSIDQSFLDDLLLKFKSMQNNNSKMEPSQGKSSEERNDGNNDTNDEYALTIANMLNQAAESNSSELNEECPICLENISTKDSVITPCLHIFRKDCLFGFWKSNDQLSAMSSVASSTTKDRKCPVCSTTIDTQRILRITRDSNGKIQTSLMAERVHCKDKESSEISEEDGNARKTLHTAMQGTSSSKLEAIQKELHLLWEKEPGSKVLIFSQFLGFLDLMEKSFERNGIPYGRLDGNLSLKRRMEVLRDFKSEPKNSTLDDSNTGSVLLISMKAGGVVRVSYFELSNSRDCNT